MPADLSWLERLRFNLLAQRATALEDGDFSYKGKSSTVATVAGAKALTLVRQYELGRKVTTEVTLVWNEVDSPYGIPYIYASQTYSAPGGEETKQEYHASREDNTLSLHQVAAAMRIAQRIQRADAN
ncbi:MAG: hypothetical protein ACYCPS_04055 [Candidatus Saccharimonadales bacterium]